MKFTSKMTKEEREKEFNLYLKTKVKSGNRYIKDLEKGFEESPIKKYVSIYEISDPAILEDPANRKILLAAPIFNRKSIGGTPGLAGLNWYIRFLKDSRDSYYDFMQHFHIKPKELFEWGMKASLFISEEEVAKSWEDLKNRVLNNGKVSIRGYGRDAHNTQLFIDFYKFIFNNENVIKDSSNNYNPQKIIKNATGLVRNKDIYNYQVSHIWGKTKNVFLFEAPWNICYTPKIIDPFTGHETKGDLPDEFQSSFIKYSYKKYKEFIDDYNSLIKDYDIPSRLEEFCANNGIDDDRFINDAKNELSPIYIK